MKRVAGFLSLKVLEKKNISILVKRFGANFLTKKTKPALCKENKQVWSLLIILN